MMCNKYKYKFRLSLLLFSVFIIFLFLFINGCGTTPIVDNSIPSPSSTTIITPTLFTPNISPSATPTSIPDVPTTDSSEAVTPKPATPQPTSKSARVVMVGDMLMHDGVINSGKSDNGYNFDHLFSNVFTEINTADLAIVNQEVIIAGTQFGISGYPYFNSPLELCDSIVKAGFDIVLNASNHTLDKGKDAMLFSLSHWRNNFPQVGILGMHDSKQDREKIHLVEINDINFAILNYTYGVNGSGKAALAENPYLVDVLEESRVRSDIIRAEAMADITIVTVHWGTEYSHVPSETQREWADLFLDNGVDLVLGTHPHVIQPIEWLTREDGHKMLVYWSLGNFVNCTSGRGAGKGARMLGAMSDVTFIKDKNGATYIDKAVAHSLITHIDYAQYGITTYFFKEYNESMFLKNQAITFDSTFSYQFCIDTFNTILGDYLVK